MCVCVDDCSLEYVASRHDKKRERRYEEMKRKEKLMVAMLERREETKGVRRGRNYKAEEQELS